MENSVMFATYPSLSADSHMYSPAWTHGVGQGTEKASEVRKLRDAGFSQKQPGKCRPMSVFVKSKSAQT
jgi:hypothetical protein